MVILGFLTSLSLMAVLPLPLILPMSFASEDPVSSQALQKEPHWEDRKQQQYKSSAGRLTPKVDTGELAPLDLSQDTDPA